MRKSKSSGRKETRLAESKKPAKETAMQIVVAQVNDKWCVMKPDGTPDVCYTGTNARQKAEAEAQKRQLTVTGSKEAELPKATTPDTDGHVHQIAQIDEMGNGKTSEAGAVPHAHEIAAFEVLPWTSPDGAYTSAHPGTFPEAPSAEEPTAPVGKTQEGRILHPFSKVTGVQGRFVEAGPKDPEGRVWEVVLIEEGMSKNGRLYSREVLQDAHERKIFEGIPAFGFVYRTPDGMVLDHAKDGVSTSDFPKDVVGLNKNVRFLETSPGKMGLVAEFHFLDDTLRRKTLEAHRLGNPGLFGLSIDAIGEGEPLDQNTVEIKYIVRANSDDLVSFPAAGGRFMRMVASMAKSRTLLREDGSVKKKLLLQLISDVKPELLKGKDTEQMSVEEILKLIQGDEFAEIRAMFADVAGNAAKDLSAPAAAAAPAAAELATAALVNESKKAIDELKRSTEAIKLDRHKLAVEGAIRESGLPAEAAELVRDLASKSVGDEAHLKACVARATKLVESAGWQDPKVTNVAVGDEKRDRIGRAIEGAMLGRPQKGVAPFHSIKHMIGVTTGEVNPSATKILEVGGALMRGVCARYMDWRAGRSGKDAILTESFRSRTMEAAKRMYGLKEAINLAQLTEIFGDSITRQMIADYELPQLNDWRAVTSKIGYVDDTRVQRRERLGQYPDLATVAEGASYVQITSLTDEEVTISVAKHGNFEAITQEALLRNDLGWFAKIPGRLARAAMQDVRKTVWDLILTNAVIYDTVALFDAAHANTGVAALSVAAMSDGRRAMREQLAYGSTFHELGSGNLPKFLIVPPELENTANQISSSQFEPTSNLFQVANLHRGINVIVLDHDTDANNWYLIADPSNTPTIEVDFVGDSDAPELWTDDDPSQGTPFLSDTIRIKVREWFGAAVLDFRGFFGSLVP